MKKLIIVVLLAFVTISIEALVRNVVGGALDLAADTTDYALRVPERVLDSDYDDYDYYHGRYYREPYSRTVYYE